MSQISRRTEQLKRTRLFRITFVYAAVAFVIWQAAEIAVPALRLPDWVLTLVVVTTLAGLPLVLVIAFALQLRRGASPTVEPVGPAAEFGGADRLSIAVLPFANLSPDPDNEYFSDGVTEDIITHLCKISDLKIISRASVMQ